MLDLARFHIGVLEAGGANRGPMVEAFQKAVDGKAQGEPWCMAFMQFLVKKTIEVHGDYSRVFQSESCMAVWLNTGHGQRVAVPVPGLLVLWQHGVTPLGHVGIISEVQGSTMKTVEGNTSQGLGVIREGDGVYMRERPFSDVGNMRLLGFLRVFG
jgi:hypothetical protein